MVKLSLSKTMLFRHVFRNKHFFVLFGFLLISSFTLQAQVKIEGQVIDERTNEPMVGATVIIKATSEGVVTDVNGKFVLQSKAALPQTLTISLMGYKPVEVRVYDMHEVLLIGMIEDVNILNEVVVVAYGTQKRGNLTAAVSSIRSEDMINIPATSVEQAMQGKLAGVQITSSSGTPGSGAAVNIRGVSSISAGNEPLWVVDGMPINTQDNSWASAAGTTISMVADINPADIEDIQVLKDASASAMYGSRATNGVILVTTKRGKVGKTKVTLDAYTGVQNLWKKLEFLGSNDWLTAMNEAASNFNTSLNLSPTDGLYRQPYALANPGVDTNWFDEVTRSNAMQSSIQLGINGGNDKTKYYISGGFFDQQGIEKTTQFKRYNLRSNIDQQITKRIKLATNIGLTYSDRERVIADNNIYSAWARAMEARPDYPAYNADGTYSVPNVSNPVQCELEPELNTKTYRAIVNLKATINIIEGLNYNISLGEDFSITKDKIYYPLTSLQNAKIGQARDYRTFVQSDLVEHTIDYARTFNKLNLAALVGYSYQYKEISTGGSTGQGFISSNLKFVSQGSTTSGASTLIQTALESYFGRVNLGYDDRYLLEGSIRRDASSKFAPNKRVGYFPAGSVGWRPSNEAFYPENAIVSNLKIRGSVGITGNQEGIGAYNFYNIYAAGTNYNDQSGLAFSNSMNNPNLTWEKTYQYGLGIDMELLKGRIALTVDLFKKDTRDLLLSHTYNGVTGFNSITDNIGSLTNQGVEFLIRSSNLTGALTWNTTFNISFIKNEITALTKDINGKDVPVDNWIVSRYDIGQPVGAFFLVKALGVFQSEQEIRSSPGGDALWNSGIRPGDMKYFDKDANGVINDDDRVFVGSPLPKFFGSIINNFTYKGFDLGIDIQYAYGHDMYANWKAGNTAGHLGAVAYAILKTEWDNRWTVNNPGNDTPRAVTGGTAASHNTRRSSRFLEDASHIRIKNITLGYEVPKDFLRKIALERLRIYATVNNLYSFTKYSGFDPEVVSWPEDATSKGVDLATVPQLRSFIFGINMSF